jgi:CubicO group peptidase (beta-lactamase class C family)
MSHRSGLCALDAVVDVLDYEGVVRAIERQRLEFPIGAGPVYSPRLFGFLLDEIVRRLAGGEALGSYWRRVFAEPLGLDFWIGLPEELHGRVATMLPPKAGPPAEADREFLAAYQDNTSATRRAFESPAGYRMPSAMNSAEVRSASLPAIGGIGSARALAKFYAMLASGGEWDGRRFFGEEAAGWISRPLAQGFDPVLRREMAFAAGFAVDPVGTDGRKMRSVFGPSRRAFGHPGAGGSLGFADPERGLGFAYVINQMELGVLPHERCFSIVRALYGE